MKNFLLAIIAVFGLCLAGQAQTPTYSIQPLVTHKAITAATATNLAAVIDCSKQASVTLSAWSTNDTAGATPASVGFLILWSVDGSHYDTNSAKYITYAPNGLTTQVIQTNLSTFGCGYMKLLWATNGSAATTNVGDFNVVYGLKKSAP